MWWPVSPGHPVRRSRAPDPFRDGAGLDPRTLFSGFPEAESPAMHLKDYLRSDLVIRPLRGRDVEDALREVATRAGAAGLGDAEEIGARLLERERQHPTVMGSGLAIPHTTVPGLSRPAIVVAVADAPIPFGPPGSDPVRILFVLLSPPGSERDHVKLLARICRLARQPGFIDALDAAPDDRGVIAAVESVDAEHV